MSTWIRTFLHSTVNVVAAGLGGGFARAARNIRPRYDKKLSLRMVLAIVCTAGLALTSVTPTYQQFIVSRQNLYDIQQYRLILDTANLLAAERGPANIVMSEEPSLVSSGAKRLLELRNRIDAALAALGARSDAPWGLHHHQVPHELLAGVVEQLALARSKVDRIAAVPRALLKREELQDAIDSMFAVSDRFQPVVAWRANELVRHDTGLAAPVLVGQMLTDLRDYGGRMASQILAAVATGQRLPLENVIDSRQSQGRVLELWQVINNHTALYDGPAFAKHRTEIIERFFGDGLSLIDGLIGEGRSQKHYSVTATELTNRFVPTMRPIEAYRSEFLDAAVEKYVIARRAALITLAMVLLVTCAILAILSGVILSIRTQIFRPLLQVHEEVLRLAEDRPQVHKSLSGQAGEIRNLFGALEVLHSKLQERASITSKLRVEADTDGLTSLLNRRALDRIAEEWARNEAACLVLLDIDHFKRINDTYGHPTGDRVLRETAALLRSLTRSQDVVARFGGEEFAILAPGDDLPGAIALARKLRLAMQHKKFTTLEGEPLRVTASFGVARSGPGADAWSRLVAQADASLYRAKGDGRNRVRVAQPSFDVGQKVAASRS
ncbi:putative diguanylate cyclase YdaM [Ensifer psoraleae]|uniref:GGDEF domain-containing protein n=1 Tax=Sinorhizobium psoraleae TaxID=520838 RepID=UPI00156A5E7A|nr:GGDEF domain-containing protein [Sinorhizobium psoraleae]NRP74912.1 putative diguanylate cyclase YdaM [Sinorhizobium psoraleae]